MKGKASSKVTKIASIFGTNTRVCSWIWVSAWNSDTTTPTTRPTTISGDDTTTMVQIASRATSRVSAPVIASLPLRKILLRWVTLTPSRDGTTASPNSDRHLHDVFVGRDHLVADRHQRRNLDVGLRHRGDDVHHIGLAGRHRGGLLVGFSSAVHHASDRVLEQVPERWTAGGGRSARGGRIHQAGKIGVGVGGNGR